MMNSAQKQFQPFVMAEERAARSVFVGNIPYEATEEQLKEIFNQAGPVASFRLVYDRETGKPKGYGFCEYQDPETASSAMRNLNNHDFNGRPLRVGVAAGESTKEENRMLGGPPMESPYGEPVEPEKAPEAVARAVASLPPEQMFELMKQMKMCILNNPNEARNMLLQNPQLAYALLQAQIVMKIVDPQVALAMLHRQTEQIPPMMQSAPQPPAPIAAATGPMPVGPGPMPAGPGPMPGPMQPPLGTPPMQGPVDIRPGFQGPPRPPGPPVPPGMMRPGPDFGPRGPMMAGPRGGLLGDMPPRDIDHREMLGPMDPHDIDRRDMLGPMDVDRRDMGPMGPMDRRDMGPGPGPMDRPMPMDRRDFGPPMDRRDMGPMDIDRRSEFGPPMDRREMLGPMDRRDPRDMGPMDRRDMPMGPRPPMGMMGERGPRGDMMGMGPRFGEPDMGPGPRPGMGLGPGPRPGMGPRPDMGPGMGPRGPVPDIRDPRQAADLRRALGQQPMSRPGGLSMSSGPGGSGATQQDQEKAALIMQVLQLSDDQIAMLPPDQRESILILKDQIARSAT